MSNTKAIEQFLRTAYSDERLAMLLAHAEDNKLSYSSCCCLIGVQTANHALQGIRDHGPSEPHYQLAETLAGARQAEHEYFFLAVVDEDDPDRERRAKLIPMIHAEFQRREAMRNTSTQPESGFPSTTVERPSQAGDKVLV